MREFEKVAVILGIRLEHSGGSFDEDIHKLYLANLQELSLRINNELNKYEHGNSEPVKKFKADKPAY